MEVCVYRLIEIVSSALPELVEIEKQRLEEEKYQTELLRKLAQDKED